MDDKRSAPRMRPPLTGIILLEGGGVIDCTLHNRSATGARLKVVTVIGIPDRFTLVIEPAGERRAVQVAWRKEGEIGVTFKDEQTT